MSVSPGHDVDAAYRRARPPDLIPPFFAMLSWLPQRHHPLVGLDTIARGAGPDRVGDEARGQVAVVLLDHPRIDVPEVLRHHQQRRAVHDGKTGPRVS